VVIPLSVANRRTARLDAALSEIEGFDWMSSARRRFARCKAQRGVKLSAIRSGANPELLVSVQ